MRTRIKKDLLFITVVSSFFIGLPASYAAFILGANVGYNVHEAADGYQRSVGGSVPSGPSGIPVNTAAYRD